MSRRKPEGEFVSLLERFVTVYMPETRGLSANTVASYKATFRLLMRFLHEKEGVDACDITFKALTVETICGFLDWLEAERGCSATTRNQRLAALRSFSEFAQNRDLSAACFRLAVVRVPKKVARGKERAFFTPAEVKALLELPDPASPIGLRDGVLLSVMFASGTRAQEICDLRVRDVRFSEGGAVLRIVGKGRKARQVRIGASPAAMIGEYMRRTSVEGKPERHVFSSQTHEHMTVPCVEAIYKKYVAKARAAYPGMFKRDSYPPHSMRHTTAVCMLEANVPLPVIKAFLGHAHLSTTEIYASLSQESVNEKVKEWNETYWSHCKVTPNGPEGPGIPDFLKGR